MKRIHLIKEPSFIAKYDAFQYQKEAFEAIKDLEYAAIFHEHVFSVIVDQLGSDADRLIDALIDDFSGNREPYSP